MTETAICGAGFVMIPGSSQGVVWPDGERPHAGGVYEAAKQLLADVVLVHADGAGWLGLPEKGEDLGPEARASAGAPFVAEAAAEGYVVHLDAAGWRVRLRSPQGGPWVSLVLLAYDPWHPGKMPKPGPWVQASSFETMARALHRYREAVGTPWRDSVGRTAETLILATHPRELGGVMLDRNPVVPAPALEGRMEQPFSWKRPLTEAETGPGWVHLFDVNAQYLAAWQTVELGFEEPEHFPTGVEFSAKRVGLWRPADAGDLELAVPDAAELHELLPRAYGRGGPWFTTDTMVRLTEVTGVVPAIAEAWCWPKRSRFLRAAAEQLRDARAFLSDRPDSEANRLAAAAVKSLYGVETGRFNMAQRDERSGWHRPDWGHVVRARARVNLHRRLQGSPTKEGWRPGLAAAPFAIQTDGLFFASTDIEDPAEFAAALGIPAGGALGQFSHEGTVHVEDLAVVDELRTPYRLNQWLKREVAAR